MPATATPLDAAKLRAWRTASGLRPEIVCADLAISVSYLARLERGVAVPSLDLLTRLARFYGHEPGELLSTGDQAPC